MALADDLASKSDDELRAIATSRDYGTKMRDAARTALATRGIEVGGELRDPKPAPPEQRAAPVGRIVGTCVSIAIAIAGIALYAVKRDRKTLEISPAVGMQQRAREQRLLPPVPPAPSSASQEILQLFDACARTDFGACTTLGVNYTSGIDDTPVDLALGFSLFERGCAGGVGLACAELAVAYGRGRGVAADRELSRTYSQLACELGVQQACVDR